MTGLAWRGPARYLAVINYQVSMIHRARPAARLTGARLFILIPFVRGQNGDNEHHTRAHALCKRCGSVFLCLPSRWNMSETTEQLLRSRGVFDVGHYGWLNEDDVDPEFVGYAMWALNPPYDIDFDAWQREIAPGRAATAPEQRLMELSHDFFGLMKTARYFIGRALLHQTMVQPFRIEPTEFDFNEFAALVALTAAADRLSDFVIVTTLARKTDEVGERNKACDKLRESGFRNEADELQDGFKAILESRKARRNAVHELATQHARVQQYLISRERKVFEEQRWPHAGNPEAPYEDFIREQQSLNAKDLADVERRAKLLCDCYTTLIKMGGLSFETEHGWRQRQANEPR